MEYNEEVHDLAVRSDPEKELMRATLEMGQAWVDEVVNQFQREADDLHQAEEVRHDSRWEGCWFLRESVVWPI